jgi:translation initiation factor 5B
MEGIMRVGTPICIPSQDKITIGKIASMEVDHKAVEKATVGKNVAMKIVSTCPAEV